MWIRTGKNNEKKTSTYDKGKKKKQIKKDEKKDKKIHNSATATLLSLPDEIMFEILSRLPVESLLRFKFVCKRWYAIIKDHKFVEMNTRRDKGMTYCYSKREGETLNLDGVEETFTYLHTFDGLLLWKSVSSAKYYIRNPATKQILGLPDPHKKVWFMRIFYHSSICAYNVVSIYVGEKEIWKFLILGMIILHGDPSISPNFMI